MAQLPTKILPLCTVTEQEALKYFPKESRCTKHDSAKHDSAKHGFEEIKHDNGKTSYFSSHCSKTHLPSQMKALEVKKVLPAVMEVAVFSINDGEFGDRKELVTVDWDSEEKKFLVCRDGVTTKMTMLENTEEDEYCLTGKRDSWLEILKYATLSKK